MSKTKTFGITSAIVVIIAVGACVVFSINQPNQPDPTPQSQDSGHVSEPTDRTISPEDAKSIMDSENYLLLDVRNESEFTQDHILTAVNLPVTEILTQPVELDHEIPIIVYCQTGGRSATAVQRLTELGYTNVYDLGGIASWPYDTTKVKQ